MSGSHGEHHDDTFAGRFVTCLILALIVLTLLGARWWGSSAAPDPRLAVPAPASLSDKPDFRAIPDADHRKQRFFQYLVPAVERVNVEVRQRRQRLQRLAEKHERGTLSRADRRWLEGMAERYRVDADATGARIMALQQRIDTLPGGLMIAQAAIESGWGTSRFAREGNNLFGEWCFTSGCGLVPRSRGKDASHEVRWFPSVIHSIRSYMHNLNSHPAYEEVRARRAAARRAGREPRALDLAGGLEKYSERGAVYVEEVRTVIRANDLPQVYATTVEGS